MPKARLFQIVWHAREGVANEPIMSIDMHPLHPLLATAGSDHLVRVWRVRETATFDATAASGGGAGSTSTVGGGGSTVQHSAIPAATVEFLFTMSMHAKTVNAVRWSPNGEFLGSADDEGAVVFCKPRPGHTWETVVTEKDLIRAKSVYPQSKSEIYDLSWAPDSRHVVAGLVSSSAAILDTKSKKWLATLHGHTQFVQGVAWDPANAYIATASNDRTVRIFRNPSALLAPTAVGGAKSKAAVSAASGAAKRDRAADEAAASSAPLRAPATSVSADLHDWPLVHTMKNREMPLPLSVGADVVLPSAMAAAASASESGEGAPSAVPGALPPVAKQVRNVHALFLDENVPTFFRRLAWSPDGSLLFTPTGLFKTPAAAPAAVSSPASAATAAAAEQRPTTYAFARDLFAAPLCHFPGTRQSKPSVVVRCSNVLYRLRAPAAAEAAAASSVDMSPPMLGTAPCGAGENDVTTAVAVTSDIVAQNATPLVEPPSLITPAAAAATLSAAHANQAFALPYRVITAIATLDAVHIYDSQLALPIATIAGYHVERITDLAWSPSGNILFIASYDGYISCVVFAPGELGEALPAEALPVLPAQRREATEAAHAALVAGVAAAAAAASAASSAPGEGALAASSIGGVTTLQPRKRIAPAPAGGAAFAAPQPAGDHRLSMMGAPPGDEAAAAAATNTVAAAAVAAAAPLPAAAMGSAMSSAVRPPSSPARVAAAATSLQPGSATASPRRRIAPALLPPVADAEAAALPHALSARSSPKKARTD